MGYVNEEIDASICGCTRSWRHARSYINSNVEQKNKRSRIITVDRAYNNDDMRNEAETTRVGIAIIIFSLALLPVPTPHTRCVLWLWRLVISNGQNISMYSIDSIGGTRDMGSCAGMRNQVSVYLLPVLKVAVSNDGARIGCLSLKFGCRSGTNGTAGNDSPRVNGGRTCSSVSDRLLVLLPLWPSLCSSSSGGGRFMLTDSTGGICCVCGVDACDCDVCCDGACCCDGTCG